MRKATFDISLRCFYPSGEPTTHHQQMKLGDIPKWIESYKFTHPNCTSISVKVWLTDLEKQNIST